MSARFEILSITGLLENAGDSLIKEPTEKAIVLRILQRRLSEIASSSNEECVVFLGRFMEDYVRRLWGNLAIDFTYESGSKGNEIFKNLMANVGRELILLAKSLREGKMEDFQRSLSMLTTAYESAVSEINEKWELILKEVLGEVKYGRIQKPEEVDGPRRELFEVVEESKAITKSKYTLAGGAPSEYFFDIDRFLSYPRFVETISNYYASEILKTTKEERLDLLAFVEKDIGTIGVLPHMSSILAKTRLGGFVVRISKDVMIGKVKCSPDSYPRPGQRIGIVSDVVTAAEGIMRASMAIRAYGAETPYAFVLYNRAQGGSRILAEHGIHVKAIIERDDLIKIGFVDDKRETRLDSDETKVIPTASWKVDEYKKGLGDKAFELSQRITV